MPGNGDFEAKCPAIWEFDFINVLLCGQAKDVDA
jgi:hypothetical protein